jgi:carotenoid cleavage dioxygenase-like enzyme
MTSSTSIILKTLFLITNIFYTVSFINNFGLGLGFRFGMKIINNINEKIILKLNPKQNRVIKELNGFYGLIGPNINMDNNIDSLYDLFMGDGVIQGVFFDNGNLTYVRHLIKTEKILYEEKYGKLPVNNNYLTLFFVALNKMKLFPNVLGMANTAILNVKSEDMNNNYALFERDHPYLVDIDFNNKDVNTVKKINIDSLSHFSGHSKTNIKGNIETIDYNMVNNIVSYIELDNNFQLIQNIPFKFKYMPIIHDFYSDDDYIIMIDSPLFMDLTKDLQNKMPVYLNKNEKTRIYVYDKKK